MVDTQVSTTLLLYGTYQIIHECHRGFPNKLERGISESVFKSGDNGSIGCLVSNDSDFSVTETILCLGHLVQRDIELEREHLL